MMKRLSPIVMILAVGIGMPGEIIWQGNITLSPSRSLVSVPRKPLSAPGPTHELCVIPRERGVDASGDSLLTLHGAVHLRVLLFGTDGQIDSLIAIATIGTSPRVRAIATLFRLAWSRQVLMSSGRGSSVPGPTTQVMESTARARSYASSYTPTGP